MSLKAFHIVFVVVSTLFALGFGVWSLLAYRAGAPFHYLLFAVAAWLAALSLVVYGGWFLKKMKDVSYL